MVGVFFVVSIILFILFNNVPGDRALNQVQNLRGKVSDEAFQLRYQEARDKLGLDDPIPVRYVKWMGNLLRGDFGYSSFYKKDVIDVLGTPLLNTIQINIMATIIALAITIPLGIHCAVKKFSRFDNAIQVLTIVGYSMPQYIVALVFIFLFSVKLIFPASYNTFASSISENACATASSTLSALIFTPAAFFAGSYTFTTFTKFSTRSVSFSFPTSARENSLIVIFLAAILLLIVG